MNAQLAGFTLGTVELVSWKSRDGATIEGVLHKPADYDPSRKYPLLVVIHGGPTGVSRPVRPPAQRYYPIEQFLAKGALVLEPNYRGSAGYGGAFRALNVRNLGIGDTWDVLSGVDALIAKGMVDGARMGSMGWSQGGYISAFLTTNTDRFKAISVGAGISDWTTYYVNTDITPFTRQYLHATPWEDPKIYASTSPMTNIRKARTPTLIQHGDSDKRVPPPNSFELYRGLVDAGVPARLILYKGFGHPITKPKSNRAVLQHNLDWFGHYVFGEPFPAKSPLYGSGEHPAQTEGRSGAPRAPSLLAAHLRGAHPGRDAERVLEALEDAADRHPRGAGRPGVDPLRNRGLGGPLHFRLQRRAHVVDERGRRHEPGRHGVAQACCLRIDGEVRHPEDVLRLRCGGFHPGDPFDVGGASTSQGVLHERVASLYSCPRR